MFLPGSRAKKGIISDVKHLAAELEEHESVLRATVFEGFAHLAFGINHRLMRKAAASGAERARFDLVVLIEAETPATARHVRENPVYQRLVRSVDESARRVFTVAALNARSMGEVVPHDRGVFLFNYFYAEDDAELIPVWDYTAGWWHANANLDNSRVMAPMEGERRDFGIINHCRWDRLREFVPHMAFRPSFRRFVLANFTASNISAQPTLYRLA